MLPPSIRAPSGPAAGPSPPPPTTAAPLEPLLFATGLMTSTIAGIGAIGERRAAGIGAIERGAGACGTGVPNGALSAEEGCTQEGWRGRCRSRSVSASSACLRVQGLGNVKRFRGGLVFKAHRLVYHSTLGLRVITKKKKKKRFRV